MISIVERLTSGRFLQVWGAPPGFDILALADLARAGCDLIFVVRDDVRLAQSIEAAAFFAPDVETLAFPAWDCLPYDRVSPRGDLVARRMDTLTRLTEVGPEGRGRLVIATVSAAVQKVPPPESLEDARLSARRGDRLAPENVLAFLGRHGFLRTETVVEPGEYAMRGGILDVFPPGEEVPVRLDFFGDEIDDIRHFDPASQRSHERIDTVTLKPASEVAFDEDAIARFRTGFRELFGAAAHDDPLYAAISAGRRHRGFEHWLPLFHGRLATLFGYLPDALVALDDQAEESRAARLDLIAEYYAARCDLAETGAAAGAPYRPVPPDRLFLDDVAWKTILAERPTVQLSPFDGPEDENAIHAGGHPGRGFAEIRVQPGANLFETVGRHIAVLQGKGHRVIVAAATPGSRDRLGSLLGDHGVAQTAAVETWPQVADTDPQAAGLAVLALERGFLAPGMAVIAEQDILGERMNRPTRRKTRPEDFIADVSSIAMGDYVVHADHGIGRFEGLVAIEAGGAPHDCLKLVYAGNDKLFLPVENIELLTRYGSEDAGAQLDKLGGAAWQARKARLKKRLRDMAEELIRVAAARQMRSGAAMAPPEGLYDTFCARFPFDETEDQARAIGDTLGDLAKGTPADRLVCGDVGFGKTEVALRAAFVAAMSGKQVAVVVPTTLLCRQHALTFQARFADYPVRIAQLSRLVSAAEVRKVKQGLAEGTVDIVIGTHALLAKDIRFHDLGLLVVDEEQHFGVAHKERLKSLKTDVHVLTLSATPIPRTLQLALTGVREMSLIATPPVDRLAVRTFVLPFDPVIVREAILRERYRGGQSFYVCPRIEDLEPVAERLEGLVPEAKVIMAHGRMPAREIEDRMAAFYDGKADVLLSTNIVESGLDLPSVNTIVIHRADRFGLAQLYQLRGRVGRSKTRAYAYLTLPPREQKLTANAKRRLEVLQTLDTLGAGFSLASHDLDIRGAGNLLGDEQSGHIREVGVELYQKLLEEAVAEQRGRPEAAAEDWSPQINLGMAVLIPEDYVPDFNLRMSLYRRLARLDAPGEIDAFAAELIDRFGPLPEAVENLLKIVDIKRLCRHAGIERLETGPKGAVVAFRNDSFANPTGLVDFINGQLGTAQFRPDHRLIYRRHWDEPAARLSGVRRLIDQLAGIAAEAPPA